jgi:hypothetical protein
MLAYLSSQNADPRARNWARSELKQMLSGSIVSRFLVSNNFRKKFPSPTRQNKMAANQLMRLSNGRR